MRKLFFIFPALFLTISLINLFSNHLFEFFLWLFTTILVSLVFFPLALKVEEKDAPVYQVFAPVLLIPVLFSIFAIMDFRRIGVLTEPQAIIYGVVTGILTLGFLWLIIGPNDY